MGCGCLSPLFGGKRTQRRVQSHTDHTDDTPAIAVGLSAVQQDVADVNHKPPPVSAIQGKPLPVGAGNEVGEIGGGDCGVSSFAVVDAAAGGVNPPLATKPDTSDGATLVEKEGLTPDEEAARLGNGTGVEGDEGPLRSSTSDGLMEAAAAPALGVATEIVDKETAGKKNAPSQDEGIGGIQAATGGAVSSTGTTDGESDASVLKAEPQGLDREVSGVAGWLEQGFTGQGRTQTQSTAKLAGIAEGVEQSDLTFPRLVVELNPVEQPIASSQEREALTNNKGGSHSTAASKKEMADSTNVLTDPNSPLSPLNGGTVATPSKSAEETVVELHETPTEVKGPVAKGGASPQGDPSGAPRNSEKNRASHLQQAFLVADLGFQMEPVRKERPKPEQIPADSAGAQKRTALEQLSLLQLDIDDDLLSDLSPRAGSVPSPDPTGTGNGNGNGNGEGKETAAHWDASESDTPGQESSFRTDASETGTAHRNGTRPESGAPNTLSPSPVSDGPVSPVQAALRLIKRSQRLASPSKKRRSVESPGAGSGTEKTGSGTEKSGREVRTGIKEADPFSTEKRLVLDEKPVILKGPVEGTGRPFPETEDGESETPEISRDDREKKLRAGTKKRAGRPIGIFRAAESAQDEESSQASSPVKHLPSEASEATTVGSSSPVGSTSESVLSDARVTRVASRSNGRQLEKARGSESGRHSTDSAAEGGAGPVKKGLRVSEISLSSSEAERKQPSGNGKQRRAVGSVTSPDKRDPQKAVLGGKGSAGESEAATRHHVGAGATARGGASEALQNGEAHTKTSAHKVKDAGARPGGGDLSPVGPTGHWQEVKASLQQPTLSWREKLSQLEESVHLFSDASKFSSRGMKSRGSAATKDTPETRAKSVEEGVRSEKAKEKAEVVPTVGAKTVRGRESGTGQVVPGQKGLGRSITTPSKRGVWKEEAGRFGSKRADATQERVVSKEERGRGKEVSEAKPQLLRSKSLPRERPERSDRSAIASKPTDLESKQLWLAAEEKRIKDEAVRLAGLAASLERETERLARQRAQAEKLERDMRERFGTLDSRSDRPSPQSEGVPSADRWAVGAVKRQSSKRGGDKDAATIPPPEALLLSPPRSRSQPGSRASSRSRSRKGEERARRSVKDEDSSSSGTTSNRSARSVRRKKFERSKSAGRLRTSELGRLPSGRKAADAFGFSGDEFLTKNRGRLEVEKSGRESKWDDVSDKGSKRLDRSATVKPAHQAKSAKSARDVPPVDLRQSSDSLEALYRAVSTGARLNDNVIERPGSRRMTQDDVEGLVAATSPASSLSSQNGTGSARERKRNQRTEQKRSAKESVHRKIATRVESVIKVPARARALDWMETDAETDMEEVRRKMRRKEMQELAELEEFEEIEKTVMDC